MNNKLMEKASFSEVCRILEDKEIGVKECVNNLFNVTLLLFPELMCKEVGFITNIANGVSILDAKSIIEKAINSIPIVFDKGKYSDFSTKYEHAQIAQVLLVFAAYFDAIKMYLPNEERQIAISENEKIYLVQESVDKYMDFLLERSKEEAGPKAQDILGRDLPLPSPFESMELYLIHLKGFYNILNSEFVAFYEKLSFWEQLKEEKKDSFLAAIRCLPEKAVKNYEKQYYQLAANFNEFFIWTNMQEHKQIYKKIDVGFSEIVKLLTTYNENKKDTKAYATLEQYRKKYEHHVQKSIVDTSEMNYDSSENIILPARKDIFIPQSFKALSYKKGLRLEDIQNVWEDIEEGEDIGKFIGDVLRNPKTGSLPLLILGHPGAGKSLLCNMLAAKILSQEYHVIIVKLRDAVADQTIMQQINQQIEDDFSNKCTWSDIVESELEKPILIIFDGYDELLQASGRTYSDYLQRIVEFQRQQWDIYGIFVKCIITSRTKLIDKALITDDTSVILLSDFDERRIEIWSEIWNNNNHDYFVNNKLEQFKVDNTSKVFDLAKQPLLLLMLALFDSNNNALRKNSDLNSTQLYDKLIREFISREKRKDRHFRSMQSAKQEKIIDKEMKRISVAALGMYNRRTLYIRSTELDKDLGFIIPKESMGELNQNGELSDGEKLLGSFFFIHKSNSTDVVNREKILNAAYEFLHNTFGEFLTANYIVSELYNMINWMRLMLAGGQEYHWGLANQKAWAVCLAYAPLFSRPVVVKMIHEWSVSYFANKNMNQQEVNDILDSLIDIEIKKIVSGDDVFALKTVIEERENPFAQVDMLQHLAIYSINIVILRTIVGGREYEFQVDENTWNKLICLWKYAFSEDDLLSYANLFVTEKRKTSYVVRYNAREHSININQKHIMKLLNVSAAIGDEVLYGIICSLLGYGWEGKVTNIADDSNLEIKARYMWNNILNYIEYSQVRQTDLICLLKKFESYCWEENDIQYIFVYYLLLNYLVRKGIIKKNERMSRFVANAIFRGLEEVRFFESLFDDRSQLVYYIKDLAINLLGYCDLNEEDSDRIYRMYSKRYYHGQYEYNYLYYNNIIMKKLIENSKKGRGIRRELLNRFHGEFFEQIIFVLGTKNKCSIDIVFDALENSYNLLLLGEYREHNRMLKMYMDTLVRKLKNRKKIITMSQKIIFVEYVFLLFQREYFDSAYVIWALVNVVNDIDLKKIFIESPKAAENICELLNCEMFMNPDKLQADLYWILRHGQDSITIRFYKQMYFLAKKMGCRELISYLNELIRV